MLEVVGGELNDVRERRTGRGRIDAQPRRCDAETREEPNDGPEALAGLSSGPLVRRPPDEVFWRRWAQNFRTAL